MALAAMTTAGILISVTLARAGDPPDPRTYDLDGDGSISILDIALLASHFLERVGTPDACVPSEHFDPPQITYNLEGTPVAAVVNRVLIPTEHPAYGANILGTPVAVRPCG